MTTAKADIDATIRLVETAIKDTLSYRRDTPRRLSAAIKDAQRGPSDEDLEDAPLIECWMPVRDPLFGRPLLIGQASQHPAPVASRVDTTTPVVAIDVTMGFARTHDSWYRLGTPADAMARSLLPEELVETAARFIAEDRASFDQLVAAERELVRQYLKEVSAAA